jgi:hypothetical protein
MLLSLTQWIQATAFFTALRGSSYVYPVILALHMTGLALFGGMLLMTDLRLLGWAMRSHSVSEVVSRFQVPKRYGLLLTASCGLLMFGAKAEEYYYNVFFRAKMVLLALVAVHALVFYRGVYAHPAELDKAVDGPGNAKLAAALSLLLWISIACCGRGIGYIEPPLEKLHADVHYVTEAALAAFDAPTGMEGRNH